MLKIIGVIVVICFLIGRIRVGIDFSRIGGETELSAAVCGVRLQLLPRKKKKDKKKPKETVENANNKKKEKTAKVKKPKKKKKPFFKIDIYDIREMLGKVVRGIGKFRRGFNCDRLLIDFTASSWDPYLTAKLFAYVNAFLSAFAPLFEDRNNCRDCSVQTRIDFMETWPKLDFGIRISLRIGAVFGMIFSILFGVLWVFIKIVFRFLRLRLFDREEYDFRMNQQEGPIAFFRRIIREGKELKAQTAHDNSEAASADLTEEVTSRKKNNTDTAQNQN